MSKHIIIFVGPGGAGKDKIVKELGFPRIKGFSTRKMRKNESQGDPYNFISEKEFLKMKEKGLLLEWTNRGDYYNGSTKEEIENLFKKHDIISVILDKKGIEDYKKVYNDIITVFYIWCTPVEAFKRMKKRGDSLVEAEKRLKKDIKNGEYQLCNIADYTIMNTDGQFGEAFKEVKDIIKYIK